MTNLVLRPLLISDFDTYLNMKRDPLDVLMSGFDQEPDRERLWTWLDGELRNPNSLLLLAIPKDPPFIPVGYLFLRSTGETRNHVEISYGVAKAFRGQRFGRLMNMLATVYVRENFPRAVQAICWVATDNHASTKNVIEAGYRDSGETRLTRFLVPVTHEKEMRKFVFPIAR